MRLGITRDTGRSNTGGPMQRVTCEVSDGIAIVRLDDGKVNVIQGEWLDQLTDALDRCAQDDVRAVVVTGREKVFCAGLDLKTLPTLADEDLRYTIKQFCTVMERLFLFEKPMVAACNGHALAGGAVVLLCCDQRVGPEGDFKVGLNEVAIGLPLPGFVIGMAQLALHRMALQQAVVEATIYSTEDALSIGYFDELVPVEDVLGTAIARAKKLGQLSGYAYGLTKTRLRNLFNPSDGIYSEEIERFISGR
jgi:enoyl-CoA hydratase